MLFIYLLMHYPNQISGGDPITEKIKWSYSISFHPGNNGCRSHNSAIRQPKAKISTFWSYFLPTRISGARYHRVEM